MVVAASPELLPHRFAEAWHARDAESLAALFSDDADFVNIVGLHWQTRSAIQRAYGYALTRFFKDTSLIVEKVDVKYLRFDVATVHTRCRLERERDITGTVTVDSVAIMLFVAECRDDEWIIVTAQNTGVVTDTAASAERDEWLRDANEQA